MRQLFGRKARILIYLVAGFVLFLLLGAAFIAQEQKEKITINLCNRDPENADFWKRSGLNLFDPPCTMKRVATIPACKDVVAVVVDKGVCNNVEVWKIRVNGVEGWQTKRVLVGE